MPSDWLRRARRRDWVRREMQRSRSRRTGIAPMLKLFDANGNRRDVVEFHPAYHELMGYLAAPRRGGGSMGGAGAGRARPRERRSTYLYAQLEDGTLCPTTMTYASVPALARDAALAAEWLPRIYACEYDPRFIPAPRRSAA